MMIGRLILINSILMLPMLGTAQAASMTVAVATNFPVPGKEIAEPFRQKNRHDMILSFGASREPFEQINKHCHFSCFFRPTAFARADLARTALRFPNAAFIHATCRLVLWRSSAKFANSAEAFEMPFSQNFRPAFGSRLLVA